MLRLHDFNPSKTEVEKRDNETVVGGIRKSLEKALDVDAESPTIMGEIR